MTETPCAIDVAVDKSHVAEWPRDAGCEVRGRERDVADGVEIDDGSSCGAEDDRAVVLGRSIAVSPSREDILDRCPPPAAVAAGAVTRSPVAVSPSPYCLSSTARSRYSRRLEDSGNAVSTTRAQLSVAGVTTEQADRYRMSRSSGKRLRSPSKPTTLWGDPCSSYNRHSGTRSNTDTPSFSHKRQERSAAERTFGGSSVFRTLNMDTYGWPRSESVRGQHRSVATGPDATEAERGLPRDVESRQLPGAHSQQAHYQQRSADHSSTSCTGLVDSEIYASPLAEPRSYKKTKRVSFHGNSHVDLPTEVATHPQPRTLPVLADKTTQTEAFLLSTWKPPGSDTLGVSDRHDGQRNDQGSPLRSSVINESEHPRQLPSEVGDAAGAARTQRRHYRQTSGHLTNPIMVNPRYQPEPTTFRRSTYSTLRNDKFPWR
ncbi:unnamed protein product [Hyaloperonospora brassicae]|uniref:RxLR effector candidate protein n=1 Tax=Hyaloperonospora brassicae TaxID=162125 RepID=A0AAV0SYV0_HYABA|nr:unnamed protein product [Hyaloperonospora brassicae]